MYIVGTYLDKRRCINDKKMTFRKILFSNKTNNRIVTIEKMKPVLCANRSLKTRFLIDFFSYFFSNFQYNHCV